MPLFLGGTLAAAALAVMAILRWGEPGAMVMLVVDAINDRAAAFYEGNGFVRLPDSFPFGVADARDPTIGRAMTEVAPASPDVTVAPAIAKAALYLRVSTGRQAESDLSIPDQRRQIMAYCLAKGWDVAAEFVEPGNTATDDRRPAFQAMIDAALVKPPTFTSSSSTPSRASSATSSSSNSTSASSPRTASG